MTGVYVVKNGVLVPQVYHEHDVRIVVTGIDDSGDNYEAPEPPSAGCVYRHYCVDRNSGCPCAAINHEVADPKTIADFKKEWEGSFFPPFWL